MIRSLTGRHRWLVPILFAASVLATLMLSGGLFSGSAGASGDEVHPETGNHIHSADLDGAGRFTGPGEVWPPRPDGAGEPWLVPEALTAEGDSTDPEVDVAVADPAVAELIGTNWAVTGLEVGVKDGKGNADASRTNVQFFSTSTNQTVDVTLTNGQVTDTTVTAPGETQPPLARIEVLRAVAIARQHWAAEGAADIDSLEGFGIRAFDGSQDFFDTRMVYVSFHVNADELPIYVSNVDLTNGTVLDARVDS